MTWIVLISKLALIVGYGLELLRELMR